MGWTFSPPPPPPYYLSLFGTPHTSRCRSNPISNIFSSYTFSKYNDRSKNYHLLHASRWCQDISPYHSCQLYYISKIFNSPQTQPLPYTDTLISPKTHCYFVKSNIPHFSYCKKLLPHRSAEGFIRGSQKLPCVICIVIMEYIPYFVIKNMQNTQYKLI